ncbi:autotransporter [Bordetella tumulicola]
MADWRDGAASAADRETCFQILSRRSLLLSLLATAASISLPIQARAQVTPSCSTTGTTYNCSLSGASTASVAISPPNPSGPPLNLAVTNNANFVYAVPSSAGSALALSAVAGAGQSAQGITLSNQGNIVLSLGQPLVNDYVFGISAQQIGGGGTDAVQGISITNDASITLNLSGLQATGGAAIWAADQSANGNDGGTPYGVQITNTGTIQASLSGTSGFAGIQAVTIGGDGPSSSDSAGYGGSATVTNSGSVALNWTWQNAGSTNNGVWGILAYSQAGNGLNTNTSASGNNGTPGGNGGPATVVVLPGGDVTVSVQGTPPSTASLPSAAVAAISVGGAGGSAQQGNGNSGAFGGNSGNTQITLTDASVTATGDNLPGLLIYAAAGAGGYGGTPAGSSEGNPSQNGASSTWVNGGGITVAAQSRSITISTASNGVGLSPAIAATLQGGAGGYGGYSQDSGFSTSYGGDGGNGASVGTINIQVQGSNGNTVTLGTTGVSSAGIYASALGGAGGYGGGAYTVISGHAHAGDGGGGGWGGNINVSVGSTVIQTQNIQSPGIVARSEGGVGASGGFADAGTGTAYGGNGGSGGGTGNVSIQTDSASSIITQGTDSMGILAQTVSAAGGNANGNNSIGGGNAGDAGLGGGTGSVTLTNGASITTMGATARGILVQSIAGSGGTGGSSWSLAHSGGGTGGNGGGAGVLDITNSGTIATGGANAQGILLQSIGGGGGAGGQASGVISNLGGSGGTATSGGALTFTNSGAISTGGQGAIGVLGQSIGGSGGDGGGASGITVTVGGTGGSAAEGGAITANLNSGSNVITSGDGAHGVIFQSIGGGGGNGGDADSTGTFVSVAVGGSGGSGGAGGTVTVNTSGANISAAGNKSAGLIAQSIGGGGGTGGSAMATSIGAVFDTSVSVGGTGGSASSDGGQASVTLVGGAIATGQDPRLTQGSIAGPCLGSSSSTGACNVLPVDSHGVVVQSIGGGGGKGGQATAQSIAVATPVTPGGSQLAVSAAVAVGGNGGAGGDGGTAQFSLSSGGTITTSGNGGVGVLVQSIGGGGGDGGDSSAMAAAMGYGSSPVPSDGKAPGVTLTATVMSNGGQPGNGETVQVAVGGTVSADGTTFTCDCDGTSTFIQTYGDYASGILAQSIGGGGGNAGQGSSSTQSFGTGSSTSLSFNVGRRGASGGSGSPGGNGGNVTLNLYPGNGIQTWGAGAVGVIAQSIGGGGGTSEGGSFSIAQSYQDSSGTTQKPGMNVNLGNESSDAGGTGQTVSVSVQAPIVTHGNDATGVLAQSIGGGGGKGGSAASDGSADNPVLTALEGREFESNVINYINSEGSSSPQSNTTMNVSIGGTGGSGGAAGQVSMTLASSVATLGNPVTSGGNQQASTGDWAHGIVAQSIGGGGGKGGSAMATGSGADPAEVNVFYNISVGGAGGSGGAGGQVNVNFQDGAAIQTSGYGATGVIAQSIGGGGGIGADGSDAGAGNVSVGFGGSGGSAGVAGNVDFENSASNGSISTAGTFADGMNLQSIGGGGGIAGAGASVWVPLGLPQVSGSMTFTAGGGTASSGAGGNVTVNQNFANNAPLNINVSGYGAYGIVAQSIGGGGGNLIVNQAGSGDPSIKLGGLSGDSSATGGSVLVQLTTPSTINANGVAGIGVVAQSVGSGGGIIRVNDGNNSTPSLTTAYNSAFVNQSNPGPANGGSVNINSYATINANGPGGIGIFAQSVGGGGGLILNGSTLYAGAPLQQHKDCTTSSCGGVSAGSDTAFAVTVSGGSVSATGSNGIGIFAQAAGYGTPGGGTPDVQIGSWGPTATVTGGTGNGAGIWIDRPNGTSSDNDAWVTVNGGGVVTTSRRSDGLAMLVTGGGIIALANYGNITGALELNTSQGIVGNGTWHPSALTSRGALQNDRGSLNNYGTWTPGPTANADVLNQGAIQFDNAAMTTRMNGHYIQTDSGRLSPMIDSLSGKASLLDISGSASVDGVIVPNATSLLTGMVTILKAGGLTSTAQAQDSLLFDWDAKTQGTTINITPNATFKPGGVSLTASQSSLADYHTRAWNNSDPLFAKLFAGLSQIGDSGTYKSALNTLSAKATQAQSIALSNASGTILGSSMSCPVFEGSTVRLGEDNCVWGKIIGRWSDQSSGGDVQGYHVSGTTYRIGGQHQVAPGWFLGASAAAGRSWARMSGGSSGNGDIYDGSITLKRVMGPWSFAGSVAAARGSFDTNRNVNLGGVNRTMTSSQDMTLLGARLRAGYEFTFDSGYIKPYNDIDLIYTHLPGFKESGNEPGALKVRGSDKTNVVISPMIEFGKRFDLDPKTSLRAYAAVGMSWRPDSSRTIHSSFLGASSADGTFTDYVKSPELLGKIDIGVQIFRLGGMEMKAGYTADFGNSFVSQTASARFAYHF